jgi:hypothetical protein
MLDDLAGQDAALDGKKGATLRAFSTQSGDPGADLELDSPPVWDGMAIAQGRLYIATQDGKITCFGK